jgi:hypothetical protein
MFLIQIVGPVENFVKRSVNFGPQKIPLTPLCFLGFFPAFGAERVHSAKNPASPCIRGKAALYFKL